MIFLSLLVSLALFPYSLDLLGRVLELSHPMHQMCLSLFSETVHQDLSQALFCGARIETQQIEQIYIKAGLIHLLVVSGSHLVFVRSFFQQLFGPRAKWMMPLGLVGFSLFSHWQPPVVRALIEFFIGPHKKIRSEAALALMSWVLTIALHPQWLTSVSLHLSLAARLALIPRTKNILHQSFLFFLFLAPLMLGWSTLHPLTIFFATLLALPSLGLWTIVGMVELVQPDGFFILNFIYRKWELLLIQVGSFAPPLLSPDVTSKVSTALGFFYVLCLALTVHAVQVFHRKREPAG